MNVELTFLLAFVAIYGSFDAVSGKDIVKLANIPVHHLPTDLQRIVRDSNLTDQSTYCCKINNTEAIRVSVSRHEYFAQSYQEKYHTDCGLFNWGSCTEYRTRYRARDRYVTTYKTQLRPILCPDDHIVCCSGSVMMSGKCISASHLGELKNPDNAFG